MDNDKRNDQQILSLNQEMLESVCRGHWESYRKHCHSDLTCFETETVGHLVEGLEFHRFFFPKAIEESTDQTVSSEASVTVTMARPHLRWLGDDAVVLSYSRLTQRMINGEAITATCCETRIWERRNNVWGQVHVHRS